MNVSRNFVVAATIDAKSRSRFYFVPMVIATKKFRDKCISGHVTLRKVLCNLYHNDSMKLRDKLKDKLPSVKALLH